MSRVTFNVTEKKKNTGLGKRWSGNRATLGLNPVRSSCLWEVVCYQCWNREGWLNPSLWWCTGTFLKGTCYFDCYCQFGSRSIPVVVQRLSEATWVIMLPTTNSGKVGGNIRRLSWDCVLDKHIISKSFLNLRFQLSQSFGLNFGR